MTLLAKAGIVRLIKQIKDFAIWTSRLAYLHIFRRTVAAPPVFLVIKEDSAALIAHFVAVFFGTNFYLLSIDTLLAK